MSRYVNVVITRKTAAVSQKGFGMPMIVSTEIEHDYKEYSGETALASVGSDYGEDSKTYKLAAAVLGQTPKVEKLAIFGFEYDKEEGSPSDIVTAINKTQLEYNDWFYIATTEQGDEEIEVMSQWVQAQEKLYFASTSNKTLGEQLNNENVILLVHENPETYPAEAWMGQGAPQTIGSFTWTFMTLNGIMPVTYGDEEVGEIENANASTYIREGGVNITSKGVTTSGEYIDIMQSQYFIKSRMTENVFGLLVREPKIPYTDTGINLIVAEVEKTLKSAFNNGIVADDADGVPMFEVSAPTRAEVATNDLANRTLPDIKWTATVAGAIERVTINGVLQL